MAAVASSASTSFSSCSISDLAGFTASGGDTCLFNAPTTSVQDPVCGNGIKEAGEVCDCGSVAECTDSCCDAATCQLASGAQCAEGACCDASCNLRPYGTTCRESAGDCDIKEYCLGDSNECPADEHIRDGSVCVGDTGYCYNGACPTHEDQCMAAFGEYSS